MSQISDIGPRFILMSKFKREDLGDFLNIYFLHFIKQKNKDLYYKKSEKRFTPNVCHLLVLKILSF